MQEMIVYLLIQIQTAWGPKDNEEFVIFCLSSQEMQTCLNEEENMTKLILLIEQVKFRAAHHPNQVSLPANNLKSTEL